MVQEEKKCSYYLTISEQDLLTWSQGRGVNEEYHRKNQDSDTLGDDPFRKTGLRTLQTFAA